MLACLQGIAVRGPMTGKQHAYVRVRDWLGESKPVDRDTALAELARRYLAGHGPADDRDLAKWTGLPLRDARAGLAAIGSVLEEREDGLVDLVERPGSAEAVPPPRLLGQYDPVLLGWTSRERSSALTPRWSRPMAYSVPSRWSTGVPPRPGSWSRGRSQSSPSARSRRGVGCSHR
jgi:hypothetical protein